jgi:uncharacterized UBP type Zn finger protein
MLHIQAPVRGEAYFQRRQTATTDKLDDYQPKGAPVTSPACPDIAALGPDPAPSTQNGCEDCLVAGGRWVHLRLCLACGKVGCCDSSPAKHASAHASESGHPVIRSFEPGETWRWCYVHETTA